MVYAVNGLVVEVAVAVGVATATNAAICGTNPPVSMYVFSLVPVLANVLRLLASWAVLAWPLGRTTPWFIA